MCAKKFKKIFLTSFMCLAIGIITFSDVQANTNGDMIFISYENFMDSSSVNRVKETALNGFIIPSSVTSAAESPSLFEKFIKYSSSGSPTPDKNVSYLRFYVPEDGEYRVYAHVKDYAATTSNRTIKVRIDWDGVADSTDGYYSLFSTNPSTKGSNSSKSEGESFKNPYPDNVELVSSAAGGTWYWDGGEDHHPTVYLEKGMHTFSFSPGQGSSNTRIDSFLIIDENMSSSFPKPENLTDNNNFLENLYDLESPIFSGSISSETADGNMNLSWKSAIDKIGIGAYEVYRDDELIASVDGNVTEYVDSGAVEGNEYLYTVRAIDRLGQYSEISSNLYVPNIAPVWSEGVVTYSDLTDEFVKISWPNATDASGIKQYEIYENIINEGTLLKIVSSPSAEISGLEEGTSYTYKIIARDNNGNVSKELEAIFTTSGTPDSVPPEWSGETKVTVGEVNDSSAFISWTEAVDDRSTVKYSLYDAEIVDEKLLGVTENNSIMLANLEKGREYNIKIVVSDKSGNENSIALDASFVTTIDKQSPIWEEKNIEVRDITGTSAILSWGKAIDDRDVKGYKIYDGDISESSLLKNVEGKENVSSRINGLTIDKVYDIKITAYDEEGNESEPLSITFKTSLGYVLVAENFKGTGFSELTDTPLLTAPKTYIKFGASNAECKANVYVPRTGKYVMWVYAKNYIASGQREFKLSLDGVADPTSFAQINDGNRDRVEAGGTSGCWFWQSGIVMTLTEGYHEISISTMTSSSRLAAIYLTDNLETDLTEWEDAEFEQYLSEYVDVKAPHFEENSILVSNNKNNTIDVSWKNIKDDVTGVKTYKLFIDNQEVSIDNKQSYSIDGLWSLSNHDIKFNAIDGVGNVAEKIITKVVSPVDVTDFEVTDSKAKMTIKNTSNRQIKAILTVAVFDKANGRMVKFQKSEVLVESFEQKTLTAAVELPQGYNQSDYEIKAMLWGEEDEMSPLYECVLAEGDN